MLELLGGQSDYFHAGFGVGAILAGVVLIRLSAAYRQHQGDGPLPAHLRFMQGQGMVQLVQFAGWFAVAGGFLIAATSALLVLG